MKKLFKALIVPAFLLAGLPMQAQQDGVEKKEKKRYEHVRERNISKTYPASGNTLNIDNSFGDVTVTTGGSEIKVDIHIEASSNQKEVADRIFEKLDVTDSKEGSQVYFKTSTSKDKKGDNFNCKNCSSTMMINYTVQLPAGTSLNIENSFGDIVLPDYNGTVSLTSKFGSLTTGRLAKAEKLFVEFGKANIKEAGNVSSTFKFSTVTIGNLGGSNKLDMEFCSASRITLGSGLTSLRMNESYSTVNLKPAAGLSANYDISTSFGSFKNRTGFDIRRTDEPDRYGPDSDRHYEGRSGSGASKIEIRSSFGKIILGEATEEELKDKKKSQGKGGSAGTEVI